MIFDKLENMKDYRSIMPQLKAIENYVLAFKQNPETEGGELDGDNLKVSVSTYETRTHEGAKYEAHRKYADVQVVVSGREIIGWAPVSDCTLVDDFKEDGDIAFYTCEKGTMGIVNEDYFMVLFPQDAHMPCLKVADDETVTKLVFKVKI